MLAIVDYGVGNLFSVKNALDFLQIENEITDNPMHLCAADGLILPGVGAFPDAMRRLRSCGLETLLREQAAQKPLLGICLGMQLLFERGFEFETTEGLGLIPGEVRLIEADGLKIPHMGWNHLEVVNPCAVASGIKNGDCVYFVHSYRANTADEFISCRTFYGEPIPALVHRGFVYGAQFHPEKSGEIGLKMLKNFARLCQ